MEWILWLIAIWIIWKLLTRTTKIETISEQTIVNIFTNNRNEMVNTKIYWEDAKKFALKYGGVLNSFGKMVEKVLVFRCILIMRKSL